jgi:hypothetical protein
METNVAYLRRRAKEERVAAMKSPDARVRQVHLTLAATYDERLAATAPPRLDTDMIGVA